MSSTVPSGMTWVCIPASPSLVSASLAEVGMLSLAFSDDGRLSDGPLLGRPVIAGSLAPPARKLGVPVTAPSGRSLVTVTVTEAIVTVEAGAVTLKKESG